MVTGDARWTTAEEAIRTIKPTQRVLVAEACGEPLTLLEALIQNKEQLKGVQIVVGNLFGGRPYIQAGLEKYFHYITFHVTEDTAAGVRAGYIDFIAVKRGELPSLFLPGAALPLDVALIQVAPPDERGYCSMGVISGHTMGAALFAKTVIAEVNDQMPRTYGDCLIHVSKISYLVKSSRPVLTFPEGRLGDEEKKIGKFISDLIPDGATLQTGIGAIPSAVLAALGDRRDLGVHSGMITDLVMDLMEKGVITNSRKRIDTGKTVTGLLMGSEKLYKFANNNPSIEVYPVTYTHSVAVMARIDNFIAMNSAVEVDLTGQVNAESVGPRQVSGVGGQADYVRGAGLSSGGKAIIAINSTARRGEVSRIVSQLGTGCRVTTPGFDVHYVVTEFGVAELKGKTLAQRAEALIKVAHPKFQEQLQKSYKESFK